MNGHRPVFKLPTVYGLLLAVFYAFCLAQITTTSPTFDEGFTLLRGYAAWRTGHLVPIGHPPLAHWLSALGVSLEPDLPDPRSLAGWYGDQYDDSSRDLLWRRGLNVERLVFLGRLPIVWLGLILGAVTARWAADRFGWRGGLAALALHTLSPNLIAHSAVATTDLPVAAFYVFTLYGWYRYTQRPTPARAALTGLMLGGALAAKFSALLLLPTLGLLAALQLWQRGPQSQSRAGSEKTGRVGWVAARLRDYGVTALASFGTLWLVYGFALTPYPLAQYVRELSDLGSLASEGHTAYLFGRLSLKGWWYYHPIVFLVKTPLPLLLLIAYGLGLAVYRLWQALARFKFTPARSAGEGVIADPLLITVVLPAFIYFTAATLSSLNVGYRYLLPALPLLHILAAAASLTAIGQPAFALPSRRVQPSHTPATRHSPFFIRHLTFVIFIWHALSTLAIAPHFLAYFNELVGARNGYRLLADSNLDWGQDLPALARYLNGRPAYVSYFGQADPTYYGINATPLPAWPPPWYGRASGLPPRFAPADPAPGLYAISASNLVGAQLPDPNTFAYFHALEPLAVVNYSIFVYEIPKQKPAASFAQCTPPILDRAAVKWLLDQDPVRAPAFDCAHSFLQPAETGLSLYPDGQVPLVDLGQPVFEWKRSDGTTYYRLYRTQPFDSLTAPPPVARGQYLTLLTYELTPEALRLHWRVETPAPPPVSIFVHFNWPDGALAEAYDALGVPAEYWHPGDVIVQRHLISPDLPPGDYPIVVGLYSLANGTRYSEIPLTRYKK